MAAHDQGGFRSAEVPLLIHFRVHLRDTAVLVRREVQPAPRLAVAGVGSMQRLLDENLMKSGDAGQDVQGGFVEYMRRKVDRVKGEVRVVRIVVSRTNAEYVDITARYTEGMAVDHVGPTAAQDEVEAEEV